MMNSGQKILNQLNKRLDYLSDHSKETERHKRTRAYIVVLYIIEILLLDKHMYFTIYNTAVIAIALGYTVWLSVITFSEYKKTKVVKKKYIAYISLFILLVVCNIIMGIR